MVALSVVRVSLAEIGRHLPDLTKHDIKCVDRLLGNPRIQVSETIKDLCCKPRAGAVRNYDPVRQHVVIHRPRNLPRERDACWF